MISSLNFALNPLENGSRDEPMLKVGLGIPGPGFINQVAVLLITHFSPKLLLSTECHLHCYLCVYDAVVILKSRDKHIYGSSAVHLQITGGTGYVGSHVLKQAVEAGYAVRALASPCSPSGMSWY